MDLNALEDFNLVAAYGGFGKASRATGRSKATLSRRISDLEEALGVRLIERGTHSLQLTEAGEILQARTEASFREISEAVTAVREGTGVLRGRLRIAAPLLFSQMALGRLGAKFRAIYPEMQLEVVAEDRVVDLIEERFDVAIRPNPGSDNTLVGRCFAKDRMVVVAAPSLPEPQAQGDEPITVPAVVMSTREGEIWQIDGARLSIAPQPVLRLSSLLMVRDAVIAGAGVALLPQSIIWKQLASGQLMQWGSTGRNVDLWVLHTSRRLPSPKVRAFVEFMCEQYPSGSLVLSD
jgi:DNA-binding transcriptional LysR family regulator